MGLELTSSTFTPRRSYYFYGDGEDHYREVMQASAFQKCDDVINGKTAFNVTSFFVDVG